MDGYATAHGLGYLQDLPLSRFANFVWYMLTKNSDEKDIKKLTANLWRPPPGVIVNDPRSPWAPQNEANALSAFKRSMGG